MAESLYSIDDLLEQMVARNASDLHITVGAHPVVRVRGRLEPLQDIPALTGETTQQLLYRILSTEQQKQLEIGRQIDLAHSIPGLARFRVNVYWQRETLGAAFRLDPDRDQDARGARHPLEPPRADGQAARARARHRPHRLG
jgi:Tfp pilus assembly protein, pilus retraction ATPase PilT